MRRKIKKRTTTKRELEAVTLYCKLRAIQANGMDQIKEAQGGKFYEFMKGSQQLCKLMGLKNFWQEDIMMCDHPDPAAYIKNNSWRYEGWQRGWTKRCELEKLAAAL